MAGTAVGDVVAAGVDDCFDRGGGQRSFHRAGVQAQYVHRRAGFAQGADGGGECAAEHAHGRGGLQAVADHIADGHGETVVGQVDDVVPVAAHVQSFGRGQVAHRDVRVPD